MNLLKLFKRKHIPTKVTVIKQPRSPLTKEMVADQKRMFKPRFGAQRRRQFMSFESLKPTLKHRENLDWLLDSKPRRWYQFWRRR